MVAKKKRSSARSGGKKLALQRETLKDLDARGKVAGGGWAFRPSVQACGGRPNTQDGGTARVGPGTTEVTIVLSVQCR